MAKFETGNMRIVEFFKNKYNICKDVLTRWYNNFANILRIVVLPGFHGVPIYDVVAFFLRSFTKGRLIDRAAAVAFNFFLAIFPLILFFFTLIPLIPIPGLYENILETLHEFLLPSGTFDYVAETINDIMNQEHEGLMSLSIFLCLIFGSSGISAIFDGFKNAYLDLDSPGWFKQRLNSLLLLFVLGFILVIAVVLISFGNTSFDYLIKAGLLRGDWSYSIVNIVRWLIVIFLVLFAMSLLYYYGNKGQKFSFFSPGAILSTTLFVIATIGFNIYISNFASYNALYGSIGTLIILLMWLWIIAIVILSGNELNVSIESSAKQIDFSKRPLQTLGNYIRNYKMKKRQKKEKDIDNETQEARQENP